MGSTVGAAMDEAELTRLLEGVASGERRALGALYERTSPLLYALCLRMLHDREEAVAALEDAYVKVWRYAERHRSTTTNPSTWLIAITRNTCIVRLHRKGPGGVRTAADRVAKTTVRADGRRLAKSAAGERLAQCLEAMDEDDAHLVRLGYFGGLTGSSRWLGEAGEGGRTNQRIVASLRRCLSL